MEPGDRAEPAQAWAPASLTPGRPSPDRGPRQAWCMVKGAHLGPWTPWPDLTPPSCSAGPQATGELMGSPRPASRWGPPCPFSWRSVAPRGRAPLMAAGEGSPMPTLPAEAHAQVAAHRLPWPCTDPQRQWEDCPSHCPRKERSDAGRRGQPHPLVLDVPLPSSLRCTWAWPHFRDMGPTPRPPLSQLQVLEAGTALINVPFLVGLGRVSKRSWRAPAGTRLTTNLCC